MRRAREVMSASVVSHSMTQSHRWPPSGWSDDDSTSLLLSQAIRSGSSPISFQPGAADRLESESGGNGGGADDPFHIAAAMGGVFSFGTPRRSAAARRHRRRRTSLFAPDCWPGCSPPAAKRAPVPPGRGTAVRADVQVVANCDHPNRGRSAGSAAFLVGRNLHRLSSADGNEVVGTPTGHQ